jgi:hypothetical protein
MNKMFNKTELLETLAKINHIELNIFINMIVQLINTNVDQTTIGLEMLKIHYNMINRTEDVFKMCDLILIIKSLSIIFPCKNTDEGCFCVTQYCSRKLFTPPPSAAITIKSFSPVEPPITTAKLACEIAGKSLDDAISKCIFVKYERNVALAELTTFKINLNTWYEDVFKKQLHTTEQFNTFKKYYLWLAYRSALTIRLHAADYALLAADKEVLISKAILEVRKAELNKQSNMLHHPTQPIVSKLRLNHITICNFINQHQIFSQKQLVSGKHPPMMHLSKVCTQFLALDFPAYSSQKQKRILPPVPTFNQR